MFIYEISVDSKWWVSANDEFDAIEVFKDELCASLPEVDQESILEDLSIRRIYAKEASSILGRNYFSEEMSIQEMFSVSPIPELLYTDFWE